VTYKCTFKTKIFVENKWYCRNIIQIYQKTELHTNVLIYDKLYVNVEKIYTPVFITIVLPDTLLKVQKVILVTQSYHKKMYFIWSPVLCFEKNTKLSFHTVSSIDLDFGTVPTVLYFLFSFYPSVALLYTYFERILIDCTCWYCKLYSKHQTLERYWQTFPHIWNKEIDTKAGFFNVHYIKCEAPVRLYQARKVRSHVFVC
jgi:hypothetical protein